MIYLAPYKYKVLSYTVRPIYDTLHKVDMSKDYKKKCSNCGTEIIMSLNDASGKWQPMETGTDNATIHRCMKKPVNIPDMQNTTTPPKTLSNGHIEVDVTNAKIIALEKRLASIESWINKISESWVMNQP